MRGMTRETDILARYGGEEFVVILPETDKEEATNLARRICGAIEEEDFFGEETMPNGKFTISLGVAAMPDDATTKQQLIDAADKALYHAKKQGRNQVAVATEKAIRNAEKRPGKVTRLGLMGGSFNPVHYGHLAAAAEAMANV